MVDKNSSRPDDGKEPSEMVDEILGYMDIIKRKLVGDDFSTLSAKVYNIETFSPEKCPECGNMRQKFFLLMQPGESLFENVGPEKTLTNYKIFCLECTKKINVLPFPARPGHKGANAGK
ncbi:MAG: hypothetical protein GYA24_07395 [Candidatus Lokiarchaeota archaeon]|nr:hypothetical protein [Candidatus Lokiarchaeota archaeon]